MVDSYNKRITAIKKVRNIQQIDKKNDLFSNRTSVSFLHTVAGKINRIVLPEEGSFNAGLAQHQDDKFIMVYRPTEFTFKGCMLDEKFKVIDNYYYSFSLTKVTDPRLIWIDKNKLLMVYSRTEGNKEYICGKIIMNTEISDSFEEGVEFRISSEKTLKRQKNWMPFVLNDKTYIISNVNPHTVHEISFKPTVVVEKIAETKWKCPWNTSLDLRGNTNAVQLDDGNFLSTFHTVFLQDGVYCYDNGCYLFEGTPPFKILKSSDKTYLPAKAASEPHFHCRNQKLSCVFPVGMVRKQDKLFISYGDNDSIVKILETTVSDMLATMASINVANFY